MRGVKIVVLGAAAVAGVGVVALVQSELDSARRAARLAAEPAAVTPVAMEEVLVAGATLERGRTLRSGDMIWRQWPKEAVAPGFITRKASPGARQALRGALVRQRMVSGEPVLDGKLIKLDAKGMMSAMLRDGMRAIAIKVAPETGAGGFILPSDYVDVILTREDTVEVRKRDGSFADRRVLFTDTLFHNVRVLAIDTAFNNNEGDPNIEPKRTATLEVTPEMAEILSLAERAGRITLALRAFSDTTTLGGQAPKPEIVVDIRALRRAGRGGGDGYGADAAEEPKTSETSRPKEPTPAERRVLVVRGSVKSDTPVD